MHSAILILSLLAANLDTAPVRETVILLDLKGELDAEARQVIGELIATELQGYEHLEVLSQSELRRALELESERAVLDCSDQSCLAEIAGAYDAQLVIFGTAGRLGELTVLSLNLFDSKIARSRARESLTMKSLNEVPALLRTRIPLLLGLKPPAEGPPVVEEPGLRVLFWAGAGTVVVGALAALGFGAGALWADNAVAEPGVSSPVRDQRRDLGVGFLGGAMVGGALAATGGVLMLLGAVE